MSTLVAALAVSFAWPVVAQSIPPTCAPRAFLMARLDTGHNDVLVRRGTNAGLVIKAFKTLLGIWTLLQVFLVSARTYNGTAKILGADCKSCPGCRTRHELEFATLPG